MTYIRFAQVILYTVHLNMLFNDSALKFVCRHPLKSIRALFGRHPSDIPLQRVLKRLPSDPFIIEAGAGFGDHTKIFAEYFPLGKIVALEPIPTVFEIAKKRVSGYSNIDLRTECLVKYGDSEVELLTDLKRPHESSSLLEVDDDYTKFYRNCEFPDRVKVVGLTLNELFMEYRKRVDLLWLDIQGMELEILVNGGNIALQNTSYLHMEVAVKQMYKQGANLSQVTEFMTSRGFEIIEERFGVAYGNILWKNSKISRTNQEFFF